MDSLDNARFREARAWKWAGLLALVVLVPLYGLAVIAIIVLGPIGLLLGAAVAGATYWPVGYVLRRQLEARRRCLEAGLCPQCGDMALTFSETHGFRCSGCAVRLTSSGEWASK